MIEESLICEALLTGATTRVPGSPPVELVLPFRNFEPTKGEGYLEAQYLPNTTGEPFVGNNSSKWFMGFLQLTVVWPNEGQGDLPARDLASEVAELWKKGTILDGNGFRVKVYRAPSIAQTLKDGAWLRVPVSIPYHVIA